MRGKRKQKISSTTTLLQNKTLHRVHSKGLSPRVRTRCSVDRRRRLRVRLLSGSQACPAWTCGLSKKQGNSSASSSFLFLGSCRASVLPLHQQRVRKHALVMERWGAAGYIMAVRAQTLTRQKCNEITYYRWISQMLLQIAKAGAGRWTSRRHTASECIPRTHRLPDCTTL